MKAIEAAGHSDVIYDKHNTSMFFQVGEKWINEYGDVVQLNNISSDTYVPLVPKKIYKVGDKVTFLEALNSGMCFEAEGYRPVFRWKDEELLVFSGLWEPNDWPISDFRKKTCTLCEDPSPPKPTLESLPAWTRCKVKPVNYTVGICDVIKKPGGSFEYYDSGNGFGFMNVKLIAVYNPKTDQWEDV